MLQGNDMEVLRIARSGRYRIGDREVMLRAGVYHLEALEEDEESPLPPCDDAIRQTAKAIWERDGEIEIDHDAAISHGDDPGAYIQAWLWVDYDDVDAEKGFNPELRRWLNERDFTAADWPDNIAESVKKEADTALASPPLSILDELGWPTNKEES
jgi:hypothetical protein